MRSVLLAVCGMVVALAICVGAATEETTPVCNETTPSTEMTPCVIEEPTEHIPEPVVIPEETESETKSYYNVNLSTDVQDVIFAECEKYNLPPEIVIAMIERESQYKQYAIGDDGRSLGLMQIQPKHHIQRMIDLGCTDLFNPHQNVTVGIDILAELYNRYGDIAKALVAYNGGSYKGTITNYAKTVIARANEL